MILKQRYSAFLLAAFQCCLVLFLCCISNSIKAQIAKAKDEFTILTGRLLEGYRPVDSAVTYPDAEGRWQDINYNDSTRSGWQPASHWDRILVMARMYNDPVKSSHQDTSLFKHISQAINFWYSKRPASYNWWHNVIGVPLKMGEVLLLMERKLSAEQKREGYNLMSLGIKPDYYDAAGKATGQNAVWVATVHLMIGLLQKDAAILRRASQTIINEVVITSKEGIQHDYSFHQHGPQLYSGGYGKGFAEDITKFIAIFNDTRYAFPQDKIEVFSSFILDGTQWATYKSTLDYSTLGREISRHQEAGRTPTLASVCRSLAALNLPRKTEFESMAARLEGLSTTVLIGNRHFWKSDFMTHHASAFYTSIKMASSRVRATESGNNENLKAWYLSRGVQFILRSGLEYKEIFPVWDWQRLPGTLSEQKGPLPLFTWGVGAEGKTAYAGGVSNGKYGLAANDYAYHNVKAKRAWFCFDKEVVCLGAAISCPTDNPLFQSINQCHQNGVVTFGNNQKNSKVQTMPQGKKTLNTMRWIHHDSIAYFFPRQQKVIVKAAMQQGSWREINNQVSYSDEIISKPVFSAWIDLGKHVKNESYSYVIVPNISISDANRYTLPIKILRNDSLVQAVHQIALNVTAAAFYQPTLLNGSKGLNVSVDKPILLLMKEVLDSITVSVSSPENRTFTLQLSINKKLTCDNCKWSDAKGITTFSIELPAGDYAGQTVSKTLSIANAKKGKPKRNQTR